MPHRQAITPIKSITYHLSADKLDKITIDDGENAGPRTLEREFHSLVSPSLSPLDVVLPLRDLQSLTLAFNFTVLAELTGIQAGDRKDERGWTWPAEGIDVAKA